MPANNSSQAAIELYNSGANNPGGDVPIVSQSRLDQVINSSHSHHYQSPTSGSSVAANTPQTKMNGSNGMGPSMGSPMGMTSPSGMSGMNMNSYSMGTPTYSTDSIVGDYNTLMDGPPAAQLKKYLEPYSQEELRKLLCDLAKEDKNVCQALLAEIRRDKKWCKLFVHGLSFSTSKVECTLHPAFELVITLHGPLHEGVVSSDDIDSNP